MDGVEEVLGLGVRCWVLGIGYVGANLVFAR